MYPCPHCNERGIHGLHKWASSIRTPAECRRCGGLVAVPVVNASGILAASALMLTAGGFLAVALESSVCFWLCAAAVLGFYVWRWRAAPLTRISADQRDSALKLSWSASLLALFVGLLSR